MSFWNAFFLLLIYIPLVMLWVFAVMDIFRRDDLGGFHKAIWVAIVIFLPYFGTLIYLISRPAGGTPEERQAIDQANREFVQSYAPSTPATELAALADLHDRGKLSDEEFAAEKARLLKTA